MFAAAVVMAGCGTQTTTVTRAVTRTVTRATTVVEQVATPRNAVFFPAVNGKLIYRPSLIPVNDKFAYTDVRWNSWGNGIARGTGSYPINTCEPTCTTAKPRWFSARFELSRPRPCRGFVAYTRIRIHGPGIKMDARAFPIARVIDGTPPC
jgi:hypothetical protein